MKNILLLCCLLSLVTACPFSNCTQMGQLEIGMTEAEALKIMDRSPDKFSANENTKYFYYSCRGKMPSSGIKFIDSKVVAYGPEDQLEQSAKSLQKAWFKSGATETEFKKDVYECTKQSQQSWAAGGSGFLGIATMRHTEEKAEKKEDTFFKMCMEARGYKQ